MWQVWTGQERVDWIVVARSGKDRQVRKGIEGECSGVAGVDR